MTAKEMAKKKLEEEKKAEEETVKKQIASIPDEGFMNPSIEDTFTFKVTGVGNIQKVKEFLDFTEIEYCEV
jgi:hypothetical protein